jgi:predicted secreted hydrolase
MNRKQSLISTTVIIALVCIVNGCSVQERPLDFPYDHGPHLDSLVEWWYFTGEIVTSEGQTLGFEFTIFRGWDCTYLDFIYLGHLAISNPMTAEHTFVEVKTTPPVAGIEEGIPEIKISNFSYVFSETKGFIIKADAGNMAVDLTLSPSTDVLPHGEEGIIEMGDGMSCYYYSFTNLQTAGKISINNSEHSLSSGRTWMDHQWGIFTPYGVIWDWFSLRLEDGSGLMLFQFRDSSDHVVRSNWSYQPHTGSVTYGEEFSLRATRTYEDEKGNCTYPIDWIVEVADIDAHFQVEPLFDEQSIYDVTTPNYWEGLCSVEGTIGDTPVRGSAYVELTGYENW